MEVSSVSDIIKKAESLTKSPEKYLSAQEEAALEIKKLTKQLYDFNKISEKCGHGKLQVLDELVVDSLDEEQIWQQIELQNKYICKEFVSDITKFLSKKDNLVFCVNGDEENNECENDEDELELGKEKEEGEGEKDSIEDGNLSQSGDDDDDDDYKNYNDNEEEEEEEEDEDDDKMVKECDNRPKIPPKPKIKSIVDDKFFKLSEMEQFLEAEENKKNISDCEDEIIYYFGTNSTNSDDEEEEGLKYDDFFDQPEDYSVHKKKRKEKNSESFEDVPVKKKKVKFAEDDEEEKEDEEDDDLDDFDEGDEENNIGDEKKKSDYISTFEARQERLKSRIKALEEEALKEKPWQLKGEVTAAARPQNSLLEEYVEFDTAVRPPPVITEKTTLKLEDIIKQRIKDKAWDDVERKIKPVEDPKEYKKKLVLNQEKSKLSLAQIYEQEYLKQKEAMSENVEEKPEEVPKEHTEIDKMMHDLFTKLDALSNFHFTPKMVSTEIKIVSNLPAVSVEEVAPVATSDATLLAPEEIKPRMKGDLIGKSERTKTDKKRERRLKKKRQQLKQKEMEKKKGKQEKIKGLSSGKNNKASKKLKLKLGRNVTQLSENGDGKYIKSSNAFFSKLQDEAKSVIKNKSKTAKLEKDRKLDVKKLKL